MFKIIVYGISLFVAYLICGLNSSIIICKLVKNKDIRTLGSGNPGTTNAIRVLGKTLGITVFILDILKVVISYFVIYFVCSFFEVEVDSYVKNVFLIGCIIGHCYPVYYDFKGGKGVACAIVAMCFINLNLALISLAVGILLILITRMVSVGSISGVLTSFILTSIISSEYIVSILIACIIIIFKHKGNIKRIINGEERTIKLKK